MILEPAPAAAPRGLFRGFGRPSKRRTILDPDGVGVGDRGLPEVKLIFREAENTEAGSRQNRKRGRRGLASPMPEAAMSVLYFAYGSNLKWLRMRERVPSAHLEAVAFLDHHRIICNKQGRDGSAKANLVRAAGHQVWGVLYRIEQAQLAILDRFEAGYERVLVQVRTMAGNLLDATTYRSDRLTPEPIPFDWYRALILEGAREHGLPEEYLTLLEALPTKPDERLTD